MAKKGRRATVDERLRAVQLYEQGKSAEEIADFLEVSKSAVWDWCRKYREGGLAALSTKFASGRPTFLTDQQMLQLYTMLKGKDPRQYSLDFGLWTRNLVAELIHRKFGVRLARVTVGRILTKLGMSPQKPLYRAYQQDPEKVRVWKQETFPKIRAAAAAAGATIFFADEAGIRTDHHAGRTWAPVGSTPVVTSSGERKRVNMISAVNAQGTLFFQVFKGSTNADVFIAFCKALVHDCPTPVFLIVDGSSAHTATAVAEYVKTTQGRLQLFFLPPYSPELNPDEWVWNNVKNTQVKRAVPMSQNHLWSLAQAALKRLQDMPHIVRGFFADPHLAYIHAE
jgi:transposase